MTRFTAARTKALLAADIALLVGAASLAFGGCSASSGSPGTSTQPGGNAGTGSSSGGSSGTVASGGNGGSSNSASGSAGAAQGGSMGSAGASAGSLSIDTSGGKVSLAFGQTYIEIDPSNGARITALRVGGATGMDVILDQSVNAGTANADNWGSVFWPSPQTWPWPPTGTNSIAAINTAAYMGSADTSSVTLTSGVATAPTVSVTKKFSADLAKEAIVIDYTMTNGGSAAVNVAPWEITRMGSGSITFYPQGTGMPMGNSSFPLPPITSGAGATWFQHTGSTTQYKLLSDGTGGWIASAIGDLILVKSFTDIPAGAAASGEAEIEIYSSQSYVEVEQQGAVTMLAPGASLNWTVRWYVRKMAAPATAGSADLVTYVQNLIK
ncbi:MAG TPA: hypothetical protein VHV51_13440 [Polyangiaceae bacterium]|jgi:hypothetical protein|nr:hypothetical protein [Polyangiaceae bacterium]